MSDEAQFFSNPGGSLAPKDLIVNLPEVPMVFGAISRAGNGILFYTIYGVRDGAAVGFNHALPNRQRVEAAVLFLEDLAQALKKQLEGMK